MRQSKFVATAAAIALLVALGTGTAMARTAMARTTLDAACGDSYGSELSKWYRFVVQRNACMKVSIPSGASFLNVIMKPRSGSFNLYGAPGTQLLGTARNKLNLTGVGTDVTRSFVIRDFRPGNYMLLFEPLAVGELLMTLTTSSYAPPSTQSSVTCQGNVCSQGQPITELFEAQVGPERGAQVTYPMDVACSGTVSVYARANANVRVSLYAPDNSRVATQVGRTVTLQALAANTNVGQWKVVVTGPGGNVGVSTRLEYPAASDCPRVLDQLPIGSIQIPDLVVGAVIDPAVIDPTPTLPPPVFDAATATPTPLPNAAEILAPGDGSILSGVVNIVGSASMRDFGYYKFELEDDRCGPTRGCHIATFNRPVLNGVLMEWDTRTLPNGTYLIRLLVVNKDGVVYDAVPRFTITIAN